MTNLKVGTRVRLLKRVVGSNYLAPTSAGFEPEVVGAGTEGVIHTANIPTVTGILYDPQRPKTFHKVQFNAGLIIAVWPYEIELINAESK